jgi:hypothetical protein
VYRYRLFLARHKLPFGGLVAGAIILGLLFVGVAWWQSAHRVVIRDFDSCIKAGYDASSSDSQTCSDGHHTYVASPSPPVKAVPAGPPASSQSYAILVQGDTRGDYPKNNQVVTTAAAWSELWARIYNKIKPIPPLLQVDFSQNEVIVLVQGVEPSSGYSLEVTGVTASVAGATVDYEATIPLSGCLIAGGPSDYLVAISTAKTSGQMNYTSTPKTRKC